MITRYEAWLDKKSLSAIDPSIYIRDIAYNAPRTAQTTEDIAGQNGQRMTSRYVRSTSVQITIEIHEQDISRRQDVCRRVQEWAMKGRFLTTNDRRGQRLRVICEEPPVIDSALRWTKPLRMTFAAYEQPFWEDERARSVTVSGMSAAKSLYAPGFGAMTRVSATVKNVSGDVIDTLTLKAGGTTFDFKSLALEAGKTLVIDYDESGLLRIRAGEESKMSCRTAASDDDLMIETGKTENVSIDAGGDVSVTFEARGLYL